MAKKKSAQNILVWILMAMLVAGLAGFGIDGFLSNTVRSIGKVGDRDISTSSYARALQTEIRAIEQQFGQSLPFAQIQAFGIDAQVRSRLVTQAALESEAGRVGISVGDVQVQRTLSSIPAFRGPTGSFDRDTYRFALQNVGQTPAEFEDEVRRDAARGILQAATAAGIETPANLRAALLDHFATRHDFAVFTLTEAALPAPVSDPDDAAIEAYYAANTDQFTAPEIRAITYAWLTPAMVLDQIEIDEDALRQLYDSRLSDYVQPERRLVERLVFPDAATAEAAKARIDSNEADFETLVEERGLSLDDTDMGDMSRTQLGEAGEAIFALNEPGAVVGPLPSPFGPALYRMNAILNAQETTFDEALPELRAELAADRARRVIAEDYDLFEDLLAGGATVEDIAAETAMELGQIDWSRGSSDGIAAYDEFRAAAAAAAPDDFPEVQTLSDGGMFVLRLDGITPPAPRPLAEVRDEVAAGARTAAVAAALLALGTEMSVELSASDPATLAEGRELPFDSFEQITRLDTLPGLPATLLDALFDAEPGDPALEVQGATAWLAVVTDRRPADPEDDQTRRLVQAIDEQIGAALAQDVFGYFARALEREAGISFNQAAIDAVHANFR